MTYYYRSGDKFLPSDESNLDLHKVLPVGNYIIKQDLKTEEFYFEKMDSFKKFENKIYGNVVERATRIFATFNDRDNSTGVLLVGEKGSGKTMLAKMLSLIGYEYLIPTIVVNKCYDNHFEKFNKLIQDVQQPCVVLFDEFEKNFSKHHPKGNQQAKLLTLLDGVFTSKKLFVLTANDRNHIDDHFENRPGRIFYAFNYKGLEESFVRGYCEDNLDNKDELEKIVNLSKVFKSFNFDMLQCLVEEMNRYKDDLDTALDYVNIRPTGDIKEEYKLTVYSKKEGDITNKFDSYSLSTIFSPLSDRAVIEGKDAPQKDVEILPTMISNLDRASGVVTYNTGDYQVKATLVDKTPFNFRDLL